MALHQKTHIDEILIRFEPDGSIRGAHQIYAKSLIDDETDSILQSELLPAEDIEMLNLSSILEKAFIDKTAKDKATLAQTIIEKEELQLLLDETQARLDIEKEELQLLLDETQARLDVELAKNADEPLTRDEMMRGLENVGLLGKVGSFFASLTDDQKIGDMSASQARLFWNTAQFFDPQSFLFTDVAVNQFGLSEDQVKQMIADARSNS